MSDSIDVTLPNQAPAPEQAAAHRPDLAPGLR